MKMIKRKKLPVRRIFVTHFLRIFIGFTTLIALVIYGLHKRGVSLEKLRNPAVTLFFICVFCLIMSLFLSYCMMNELFSIVEQLSSASQKVTKGMYDTQINYDGIIAEIDNMTKIYNTMVSELNSVEILKSSFVADVSHEFKTPLSSISGYVTLLQDPDLSDEERAEYAQLAFFNIEKLNTLTENILRLSKLETQNRLPAPVSYRLDEQIREAIVLYYQKANEKQLNLDIDLQEITYLGQKELLFQVWTNLIANAIKFSNEGGSISISLRNKQGDIQLIVSDEGIGMSEQTQAHIFDKFYQGDTSRRSQGNGLGLALCKEIIDKCDGKIYVTSGLGKGSVFMVTL